MENRERYEVKDANELLEKFGALQTQLKDLETHLGFLLGIACQGWRQEARAHILDAHYTSVGVECDVWLPVDKKTYHVTIVEKGA